MAHKATHTHHRIDYIELAATDIAASKKFFTAAFGWTFTDYGPEYAGFSDGRDGEAGGLRLEKKVATGGPLVVMYSSAIEKTRDAVKKAGAKLTKDIFEFPGGRRFQFLDPAGNELAVWGE